MDPVEPKAPKNFRYLPVPRNSLVLVYDWPWEEGDEAGWQDWVEQLIVYSGHNDFLVVDMPKGADMEIVERRSIEEWLDRNTKKADE